MSQTLSKLYVDREGVLRCGDEDKKASIVKGIRIEVTGTEPGEHFMYRLIYTTWRGLPCHGYRYSCSKENFIDRESQWE